MKRKSSLLLQGARQRNLGAVVSGLGFLLYLGVSALEWTAAADVLALLFALVSVYVFLSVAAARRNDKEAVSYNLLWGQGALALLLCTCAVLTVRERLGL